MKKTGELDVMSVGAALMDQIAHVTYFPNEDEEVFVPELVMQPGGSAANFSVLCSRLGAKTGFIGKIGCDSLGAELLKDLESEGVDCTALKYSKLSTGTVFIAVRPDGERAMFAYSGAANDLRENDIDTTLLNRAKNLYLSNLENTSVLLHCAKSFGGAVFLNPGGLIATKAEDAKSLISASDVLICSEPEAQKISGKSKPEDYLPKLASYGAEVAVITRGKRDTIGFDGERTVYVPTFDVSVVDTTGAGDSFSAGFVFDYTRSNDLESAIKVGNACASIIIQNLGARSGLKDLSQICALLG